MQHKIIERHNLLDDNNNLIEKGYCTSLLPIYNKKTDFLTRFKTKEWDYYYIGNNHFGLALTIADNGYMGLDSISFLSFDGTPWEITISKMQALTLGKKNLPSTSETGNVSYGNESYLLSFENDGKTRHLSGFMSNFKNKEPIIFDVTLTDIPKDSMVIATPFEKSGHFYFNQKINCMVAEGTVQLDGKEYTFNPDTSFGLLDWGRGIWTYQNTWYWSSLNTMVDGHRFGFNLGYGFGDTSAASENMLFYDGIAHKLDQVTFNIPEENGIDQFTQTWAFTSNDNRVNLTFVPVIDRASDTNVVIIRSNQHQVFGQFYGDCILDDGTVIHLDGQLGFAEKVFNKW